jgi:aminopeptidase N
MEAAHALASLRTPAAIDALMQTLLKDSFWGVQAEAAWALSSVHTEESTMILMNSLDVVTHPKVRRAIYGALKGSQSKVVADAVAERYESEASYFAWAEGLTTLCALRHPKASEKVKAALKMDSWNDVIRSAAVEGLAMLKNPSDIPAIISFTRPGHHPRLRMAAIRALTSFGKSDPRVQPVLLVLTQDSFVLVRNTAVRALAAIADERAVPALKKLTTGDLDGRLLRLSEEAIETITKGFE